MSFCLVIEDNADQRTILTGALHADGHEVVNAQDGKTAVEMARLHQPEVILLDLGLPDVDGIELIPELLSVSPLSRIIVTSGRDSVRAAVEALRAGARHYLLKPWEQDELLMVVSREARVVNAEESERRGAHTEVFWGSHGIMIQLHQQLDKLTRAPMTPVLIEGETGVGKEVIANELHRLTGPSGLFVPLNCAAIPRELLESELFGHERGAFTGAESRHRGVVELARDGTLFLDEIAETPLSLQSKLLRFLENHRFRRVGGEEELTSPSRIVAATNRDLNRLRSEGKFREDFYFRLGVVRLWVPPLRDRREDVLPLAYFLLSGISRTLGRAPKQLSAAAEGTILQHAWPGNVRELRNRLERAMVLGDENLIHPEDLDLPMGTGHQKSGSVLRSEATRLRQVLDEEGWNVAAAARRLGVERHWLIYRMRKHGLQRSD